MRGVAAPVPLSPRKPKCKEPNRNPAYWERRRARRSGTAYYLTKKPYQDAYKRRLRYGITVEEFDQLMVKQDGRCAICRSQSKLTVDHDHDDGSIRGLLCYFCNLSLIAADRFPNWFASAERYLNDR